VRVRRRSQGDPTETAPCKTKRMNIGKPAANKVEAPQILFVAQEVKDVCSRRSNEHRGCLDEGGDAAARDGDSGAGDVCQFRARAANAAPSRPAEGDLSDQYIVVLKEGVGQASE
jgi:hypothetical protein